MKNLSPLMLALALLLTAAHAPLVHAGGKASSSSSSSSSGIGKAELRLGYSTNTFSHPSSDLATDLSTANIEEFKSLPGFTMDASTLVLSWFALGVKVGSRWKELDEKNATLSTSDKFLKVQQANVGMLVRFPFLRTKVLYADIFADGGYSNTQYSYRPANQSVHYENKGGSYARAGASVAIGFGSFSLFAEGGPEWNHPWEMKPDNTTFNNDHLRDLDLSGTYFAVGIRVSDLPGFWAKKVN